MTGRPKIVLSNLDNAFRLNESFLRLMASRALALSRPGNVGELDIVILDDRRMRGLNRRYKRSGRSTDVLSFRIGLAEFGSKGCTGQIAICASTASKNARIFKSSFERELILYIIHGILHLCGYDDQTKHEAARMSKRQNTILNLICKNRDLSKVLMPR